jgi:hypothetical protein
MVCVIRRKGEHRSRYPGVEVSNSWINGMKWPAVCSEETGEIRLGLVLLSPLFVIILVKYVFDSREQGPPLLRSQGARGGSRGRRG